MSLVGIACGDMSDINPLSSLAVKKIVELNLFGFDVSITNSSLFMIIAVALICIVLHLCTKNYAIIPSRLNVIVENLFGFIGNITKSYLGHRAVKFFPYILALFLFVFVGNLIGLIPVGFCFTSQIVVTFALAILVFLASVIVGVCVHGIGYFKRFVPGGVSVAILPLLVLIEVISFIFRPVSMGIRLFANMTAGHMMLDIIAHFAVIFVCNGYLVGAFSVFPVALNTVLTLLKMLVCFIQAYIFVMLSCAYFGEALEEGH